MPHTPETTLTRSELFSHALECIHPDWQTNECAFCDAVAEWKKNGGILRAGSGILTRAWDAYGPDADPVIVRARATAMAMLSELIGVPFTRHNYAKNPGTEPHLLAILAHDPVVAVREAVVFNPRLPASVFVPLAQDSHERVRAEVARCPRLTNLSLLAQLAVDPARMVRDNARNHRDYAQLPDDVRAHSTILDWS